MSLFKQSAWVPYVGPQEGTGWISEDGEIDYSDEPPGPLDLSQFSDDEIDQLREAFEQDGRNLDEYLPNESAGESSYTTENNVFEEMGVSIDDLKTSEFRDIEPQLDRESVEELKEGFSEKHGEAWDDYYDLYRSWKGRSDDDDAVKREKALIDVLGIENPNLRSGESEDFDPEEYDPPEELVEVAQDVVDSTRNFLREHYTDEDGNVEVSRGTSTTVGYNVWDTVFKKFLDGETIESADLNLKSMANYTVKDSVSEDFGKKSVQIIEEKNVEDAICAEDLILNSGGTELETSFVGGQTEIDPEQIKIQSDWNPLDLLENADSIDDDTWDSILGTCDRSLGRNRVDVRMERDLSLDPDVLEAKKKIANTAIENADDEEVVDQAYSVIEESNKYLRLMDENKMSKEDSQLTIDLTGEEDNNWLSHADDDEGDPDATSKADWEPYIGPQGGEGWRNTETDEIEYGEEPPGKVDVSDLSDSEVEQLRQTFAENGIDLDNYIEDGQSFDTPTFDTNEEYESYVPETHYDVDNFKVDQNVDVEKTDAVAKVTEKLLDGRFIDSVDISLTEKGPNVFEPSTLTNKLKIGAWAMDERSEDDEKAYIEGENAVLATPVHEWAHAIHTSNLGENPNKLLDFESIDENKELIEEEVSELASMNPAEFVAEVFTLKALEGQEFSQAIEDLYEEYQGPRIEQIDFEDIAEDIVKFEHSQSNEIERITEQWELFTDWFDEIGIESDIDMRDRIDVETSEKSGPIFKNLFSKDWEPYIGPQGGEGWRNPDTDEIHYGEEPPGETDFEFIDEVMDPQDVQEGDTYAVFGDDMDVVQIDVIDVSPTGVTIQNEDGTESQVDVDDLAERVIAEKRPDDVGLSSGDIVDTEYGFEIIVEEIQSAGVIADDGYFYSFDDIHDSEFETTEDDESESETETSNISDDVVDDVVDRMGEMSSPNPKFNADVLDELRDHSIADLQVIQESAKKVLTPQDLIIEFQRKNPQEVQDRMLEEYVDEDPEDIYVPSSAIANALLEELETQEEVLEFLESEYGNYEMPDEKVDTDVSQMVDYVIYQQGDRDIEDVVDFTSDDSMGTGTAQERIEEVKGSMRKAMNTISNKMDPNVEAFTMYSLNEVRVERIEFDGENTGSTIKVDPSADNKDNVVMHEIGHTVHNAIGINSMGIDSDSYEENVNPPEPEFGYNMNLADDRLGINAVKDIEDAWQNYADGNAKMLRSYQNRNLVEYIAVSFRYAMRNELQLERRDPEINALWEKVFSGGEQ